jgi:hypothetical protein
MKDVENLLGKFGLDMRQQFGEMLDTALDWALSVFMEVVSALDMAEKKQERATQPPSRDQPPGEAPPQDPPSGNPSSHRPGDEAGAGSNPAQAEPSLDDELAALKKQVRSSGDRSRGRAPTPESVEEALEQIKERAKKKP